MEIGNGQNENNLEEMDIIDEFIAQMPQDEILGALLVDWIDLQKGSDFSSCQVLFISKNLSVHGTKILQGILMEYEVIPSFEITERIKSEMRSSKRPTIHALASGFAYWDPHQVLSDMVEAAQISTQVKSQPLTDIEKKELCLEIYKTMRKVNSMTLNDEVGIAVYLGCAVYSVYQSYSRYRQREVADEFHFVRLFTDEEYRAASGFDEIPDSIFNELMKECCVQSEVEELASAFDDLADYVLEKMGGFDGSDWVIQ